MEPLFGAGAFVLGGHRLRYWLECGSAEAEGFGAAWAEMRAEVQGTEVPGPLRQPAGRAGEGGTEHFQRDITRQREQVAFEAFSRDVGALPDEHPALRSWLEVGS